MSAYKALVIDDDEGICQSIAERLDVLEHTCDCARSVKEARGLLKDNEYNYIILDMEIPNEFGKQPDIANGELFLKVLRNRFPKEAMPIIVITAHAARDINIGPTVVFNGATDFILKPLALVGEHTLETSIAKFVGFGNSAPKINVEDEWLTRTQVGNSNKMEWQTVAKNGNVRKYQIEVSAMRCKLLDCIFSRHRSNPFINHQDIMDKVGWYSKAYYAKKGGAARGPLRGHVAALRRDLGMNIVYFNHGIKVMQPED